MGGSFLIYLYGVLYCPPTGLNHWFIMGVHFARDMQSWGKTELRLEFQVSHITVTSHFNHKPIYFIRLCVASSISLNACVRLGDVALACRYKSTVPTQFAFFYI